MKKIIILIGLFLIADVYSQTMPSAWTTNYRFRKYAQGANPGADSLNANWDGVDTAIDTLADNTPRLWKANTFAAPQTFSLAMTHRGQSIDTIASRTWVNANVPTIANVVTLTGDQSISGGKEFLGSVYFGANGWLGLPTQAGGSEPDPLQANHIFGDQTFMYYTRAGVYNSQIDTLISYRLLKNKLRAIDYDIFPSSNDTRNFGGSIKRWGAVFSKRVYTDTVISSYFMPASGDTNITFTGRIKAGGIIVTDSTQAIGTDGFGGQVSVVYTDSVISPNGLYLKGNQSGVWVEGSRKSQYIDYTVENDTLGWSNHEIWKLDAPSPISVVRITPPTIVPEDQFNIYLTLYGSTGTEEITFVDGGNLTLAGNFVLGIGDVLELMYDATDLVWYETNRSNN